MNAFDVKSTVNLSKPFSFVGDSNKCDIRNGYGKELWKNDHIQKYQGLYHENSLHGAGKYHWGQLCYEGKIYANNIHGYGRFSYPDGSYFEGLFKINQRYGPGIYTYPDNTQDVGLWMGNNLIRLTTNLTDCVPRITKNNKGRAYLNKYKHLIPISKALASTTIILDELNASDLINEAHHLYNNNIRYSKCLFFNVESYDAVYNQTVKVVRSFENDIPLVEEEQVTELLAWNNEEDLMELRKFIFFHRNFEKELSYDVESILEERDLFSPKGILEQNCEELFMSTCNGDNLVQNLIINFDLNPDVCDKLGNTAVHCAVSKDNIPALSNLVNYGANLDRLNDECLTPLLICLLRYIQEKDKVNDWQDSFLPPLRESAELSSYIFDISCKFVKLPDKKPKVKKAKKKKEKKVKHKKGKGKKGKVVEEPQPEPPVVVEIDPEILALQEKLSTIRKTISTLLCYGTNPNFGEVPLPPLFVSLFTFDEDIVNDFLKNKADSNLRNSYQDGFLTPLHVLTSMKPQPELLKLAQILLENGADPFLRANDVHWTEEKYILGLENCPDEGKTALHLLCMRYDYIQDEADYLGSLYDVMIELGSDPNLFYLGHTCLSLAVLRGNLKLIDHILKTHRIDPNQYLGCEMGVPLTVLILKRYKNAIPLYACKDVFDNLIKYNANPFNSCSEDFNINAIEFCEEENKPVVTGKKAKVNKKEPHYKVTLALKKTAEVVLDKHIMSKIIKCLFYYKIICEFEHQIFGIIVKFLDIKETQRILQILIDNNEILLMPEEIMSLLTYVNSKSFSKSKRKTPRSSKKSKSNPLEDFVNNLQKHDFEFKEIDVPDPEIDSLEDKYIVCYNCFKKEGKTLILCPRCQMVYFCSVQCNKANLKKKKSRHKCKGMFYIEELKKTIDGNIKMSALQELEYDLRSLMMGADLDTDDLLKALVEEKMRSKEISDTDTEKMFKSKKSKGKTGDKKSKSDKSTDKTGKDKKSKKDKSDKTSKTTDKLEKKKKTKKDKTNKEDERDSKTKSEKDGKTKKGKKDKRIKMSESTDKLEKKSKSKKAKTDKEDEKSSKTKSEKEGKTKKGKKGKSIKISESTDKLEKKSKSKKAKTDKGDEKSSKTKSEKGEKTKKSKKAKSDKLSESTEKLAKKKKTKTYKEDEKSNKTKSEKSEKAKRKKTDKKQEKSKSEKEEKSKRKKTDKGDEKSSRSKSTKSGKTKTDKSDKSEKATKDKTDKRDKKIKSKTEKEEKIKREKPKKDKSEKRDRSKTKEEKDKRDKSKTKEEKDIRGKSKTREEKDKKDRSKAKEVKDKRERSRVMEVKDKGDKSKTKEEKYIRDKSKARELDEKRDKSKPREEKETIDKSLVKEKDIKLTDELDQDRRLQDIKLKDKVQTDRLDTEKMESLGEKLDITKLTSSLEYIFGLNEKYLPCVVLINGQLYYKFKKYDAYCNINYSSL